MCALHNSVHFLVCFLRLWTVENRYPSLSPVSPQRPARVRHREGGEGHEEAAERPHETEGKAGTPGIALPRGQNGATQIQGRLDFVMSFFQVYLSYPK